MGVIATNVRNTRQRAAQVRFYPVPTIPATNVQDAIEQVTAAASAPPSITPKTVNFGMSPYTILPTDYLILVDTSGGAVQIQTQGSATRSQREVTIKDATGNASANNISILRTLAETIDGLTTYPIASDFGAVTLRPVTGGYAVS